MDSQIEILASLQTVDREIKEQKGIKQELLGELQAKDKEIDAKKREIALLTAAYSEKEKLRLEKDRVLQEEGKKAMDKRMRMNRIKNIKELQALQREIDQIKQSNGELEEQLITVMEEIDGVKAAIKSKEEELAKIQDEWKQKQDEMQTQISSIDQAVSEASRRRQSIATQVTRDLISRYELIFSRRGGTAVVEVAGGICQGCYMNIPPQLWNEIIRNEKVNLCPSCQRILYYKAPAVEEKSA
ncbi:MAG TPA: C4-type zinc ribbon domain-containing protein [Methylomirabilota bacterium]|nr:C4-type zinc ribbon domain-containing protein [Methylomirabilota bacterium]